MTFSGWSYSACYPTLRVFLYQLASCYLQRDLKFSFRLCGFSTWPNEKTDLGKDAEVALAQAKFSELEGRAEAAVAAHSAALKIAAKQAGQVI